MSNQDDKQGRFLFAVAVFVISGSLLAISLTLQDIRNDARAFYASQAEERP